LSPLRWWLARRYKRLSPGLAREVLGLRFPGPVGLAAGLDKDARYVDALSTLGFGFIEIGTVTPRPQPGNPKPRLFRLPLDRALVNRMGFNNEGATSAAARLRRRKTGTGVLIGGNIGKNKDTAEASAAADYVTCLEALYDTVDYFVVNVSSPNTPGLRSLQDAAPLGRILSAVQEANRRRGGKPLLVKVAPDLTDEQLDELLGILPPHGVDGVVATNTTISREGLRSPVNLVSAAGEGGLSGAPLKDRSTAFIRKIRARAPGLCIIASGGILEPADALEKTEAGADLVQVYTGFVYEGPALVRRINETLAAGQSVRS
jgi:dihydroorotate dehydrogenase